jgi:16S rRNA (cytosine1402-N4)-methyltransferase
LLEPLIGKDSQKKDLAKLFQAIRIEVNDEMGTLKKMLSQLPGVLGDGGRVAILTYHSLEDRLVKNFFKTGNVDGKIEKDFYGNTVRSLAPVNGKVITPDADEIQRNPRSRSAKLRVAEKIGGE